MQQSIDPPTPSELGNLAANAFNAKNTIQSQPVSFNITLRKSGQQTAQNKPIKKIPASLIFISPDPTDPSQNQLFLDQVPVRSGDFSYDPVDHIIMWNEVYGGGRLIMHPEMGKAYGQIGGAFAEVGVTGQLKAIFNCYVAKGAGVTPAGSGSISAVSWNPASQQWKSASWSQNPRLKLEYYFTPKKGPFQPAGFEFKFVDLLTGSDWSYEVAPDSVTLEPVNGNFCWDISFFPNVLPATDSGTVPSGQPSSVFPQYMSASEDAAAVNITGGFGYQDSSENTAYAGFYGAIPNGLVAGYFSAGKNSPVICVFDGSLYYKGKQIPTSCVIENTLQWHSLTAQQQADMKLPASGSICFDHNGQVGSLSSVVGLRQAGSQVGAATNFQRLVPEVALQHLQSQLTPDHPCWAYVASKQQVAAASLHINGLLTMTPFSPTVVQKDGKDATIYTDVVSQNVRADLTKIMQSFIPGSIWSLLFPGSNPPQLSGTLATVAATPVKNYQSPSTWYTSLATAVMTNGMANGTDPNCANMNQPRSAHWLHEQVASSPIYRSHSSLLFAYEWQNLNTQTSSYLQDQINNATQYNTQITDELNYLVGEIQQITNISSADQTKLIEIATAGAQYAQDNNLYWAYHYYCYNVSGNEMINFQVACASGVDNTLLSRLLQQNVSVLTALDPSGFYAKKYVETVNTYVMTSILPLLVDAGTSATDFSVVQQYLQQLVDHNLMSTDKDIAAAAANLNALLQDEEFPTILKNSISTIAAFSNAMQTMMALPLVAQKYTKWFKANYPKFANVAETFSGVLMVGIGSLLVVNLVISYKSWNKLKPGEKSQIITATVAIGSQALASMVKFGVRAYALWSEEGMTSAQKAAAMLKVFTTDDSDLVSNAMSKIGSNFARWIGTTSADASEIASMTRMLAFVNGTTILEEMSFTEIAFGRNLCEFIGQRLGPVLILAGIGYSIYLIVEDSPTELDLASNILGLVSGSLFLMSFGVSAAGELGFMTAETAAAFSSAAGAIGVIAALAGVGIMIYQMLQTPPDPVQTFVDNYVKPAGFFVSSKCNAIDYTNSPYLLQQASGTVLLVGTTIGISGVANQVLTSATAGTISMAAPDNLADSVLTISTDGQGLSTIEALVPDAKGNPIALFLSLMSDGTLSFQPQSSAGQSSEQGDVTASPIPTVTTQWWLANTTGSAVTANSNTALASLQCTLQPVNADANGKYKPSGASGYLTYSNSAFSIQTSSSTTFVLTMAARAPQWMTMHSLQLLAGVALIAAKHKPSFLVPTSFPLTFALEPTTVPSFLTFNANTGDLAEVAFAIPPVTAQTSYVMTASSTYGSTSADFTVAAS